MITFCETCIYYYITFAIFALIKLSWLYCWVIQILNRWSLRVLLMDNHCFNIFLSGRSLHFLVIIWQEFYSFLQTKVSLVAEIFCSLSRVIFAESNRLLEWVLNFEAEVWIVCWTVCFTDFVSHYSLFVGELLTLMACCFWKILILSLRCLLWSLLCK